MKQDRIMKRAHVWVNSPFVEKRDREIVQNHLKQKNTAILTNLFCQNLSFGTGGIRTLIGPGSSCLNYHTVSQITQAFATFLKRHSSKKPSICVGFDCRKFSPDFARQVAQIMAANQIKVYLFDHITPTPLLSHAIKYHKASGGVMITASHNPREYNGYKAYGKNAAQLTYPDDQEVIEEYEKLEFLTPLTAIDFQQACDEGMISIIDPLCEENYYRSIAKLCFNPSLCREYGQTFSIAFTPLHGTGGKPVLKALNQIGLKNIHLVPEQQEPDENFPTVDIPNPEEPAALEKLLALMKREKTNIALATDPDSDRLSTVVSHGEELYNLNGNQIALILLHYILTSKKNKGTLNDRGLVVKSIVSTDLITHLAQAFHCQVENTLPGFKWICQKISHYQQTKRQFELILGTEEAFGYLAHNYCLDKDGIHTSTLIAEAAIYHHAQGRTLIDALDIIYEEYGYSRESQLCFYYKGLEGSKKIQRIMEDLRRSKNLSFPGETLKSCKDFLLEIPASNMLEFHFESGNKLYARPSGTEAKIKFYTLLIDKNGSLEEKKFRSMEKIKAIEAYIRKRCEKIN